MHILSIRVTRLPLSILLLMAGCGGRLDEEQDSAIDHADWERTAETGDEPIERQTPDPATSADMDEESVPAAPGGSPWERCGSTAGDEGTAEDPISYTFLELSEEGRFGTVGTGASCYRIEGAEHGWQLFVQPLDDPDHELDVDLYVYAEEGFQSEPICVDTDPSNLMVDCTTYIKGQEATEGSTGHVVYVVIDGAKLEKGASYLFYAGA